MVGVSKSGCVFFILFLVLLISSGLILTVIVGPKPFTDPALAGYMFIYLLSILILAVVITFLLKKYEKI